MIALYEAGHPHHLATEELREAQRQDVSQFEKQDPWFEDIENYVKRKLEANPDDWFLTPEFLQENGAGGKFPRGMVLGNHDDARNDKQSANRLGIILRQLGLSYGARRVGDRTFRAWFKKG